MRPSAVAPGALLVAALLAGCLQLVGAEPGEIAAREAFAKAEERARAWRADAQLALLGAFESSDPAPFPGNESTVTVGNEPFEPDRNVGNGRAPQWFAQFVSAGSNAALGVLVYANGTTVEEEKEGEEETGGYRPEPVRVDLWRVDSPRAVQAARGDANFSSVAREPDAVIGYALGVRGAFDGDEEEGGNQTREPAGAEDEPIWFLSAWSEARRAMASVVLDARTGQAESAEFQDFNVTFGEEPRNWTFRGSLSAAMRSAEHEFEVGLGHEAVEALLTWEGSVPTDRAVLEVYRQNFGAGRTLVEPDEEEAGEGTYRASYRSQGFGSYVAVVRLASSAPGGMPGGAPVGVGAEYALEVGVR